jgi:hypothetical protein
MVTGVGILPKLSTHARKRYYSFAAWESKRQPVAHADFRSIGQDIWNFTCLIDTEGYVNDSRDDSLHI